MKRTKGRLRLCITLLCLNLLLIWGSSLMNDQISSAFSGWIGDLISKLFPDFQVGAGGSNHGFLRKLGHITEFCCLGLLLSWLVRMLKNQTWEHILLPLLGGIVTACADETIQRFVPGRYGCLTDVGIDTLGITLGILLITLILRIRTKHLEESKL